MNFSMCPFVKFPGDSLLNINTQRTAGKILKVAKKKRTDYNSGLLSVTNNKTILSISFDDNFTYGSTFRGNDPYKVTSFGLS